MRLISVLSTRPSSGSLIVQVVLRLSIPQTLQTAAPQTQSVQPDVTPEELGALRSGSITENVISLVVSPSITRSALQTQLMTQYTALQSALAAAAPVVSFQALSWDGAAWS